MYSLFKRILRKTYLRYSLAKKTPRLFSLAFSYFDSDFGYLKIEIYDHLKKAFSTFGFLASSRSFKWRDATVSSAVERFPCVLGRPVIFRVSGPLSGHPGAVVFSSISLYAGYEIEPLVYFVGGFEASPRAVVLNKIPDFSLPADEASGTSACLAGWTGRFMLENRQVFGLMVSDEGRRDGYFQIRGVAETVSTRFPLAFPAAGPDERATEHNGSVKADDADENTIADNVDARSPGGEEKEDHSVDRGGSLAATAENPARESDHQPVSGGHSEERDASVKNEQPYIPAFFSGDASWHLKLRELDPDFVAGVIERAGLIADGHFDFMNRRIDAGEKFDFNDDFNGGTWPDFDAESLYRKIVPYPVWKASAQKTEYNGSPLAGFHFSKHSFLVTLGLAFKFTSDSKYAARAFEIFGDFRKRTAVGRGISYASPSAVAQRAVSWVLCRELFKGCDPSGNPFEAEDFMPAVAAEVGYALLCLSANDNMPCPAEILMGLLPVYGLLVLNPDFQGRQPLTEKVFGEIRKYLSELINSEGSYIDGSLPALYSIYQGMTFALASSFKAGNSGHAFISPNASSDPFFLDKIFSVAGFLKDMALPDGRLPMISDHFPQFHLPFSYREGLDLLPLFQLMSFITGEKELKYLTANHKVSEIMMMFGESGVSKFTELSVLSVCEMKTAFEKSGYYVSSSSYGPYSDTASATRIIFDAGTRLSSEKMQGPWESALS
ncbi:MAG TPA: hypothetical protein PKK26_08980, partial [Candidatus Wallbacteria bacterium]|nr:hypothetical protein [Candidatus Wallbacteria bacterium]